MKIRPIYGMIGMLLSTSLLGIAYLNEGYEVVSLISGATFLIYLISPIRSTSGAINLYFIANLLLAALGTVLDLSIGILILAVVTALAGWDLSLFAIGENGRKKIVKDERVTRRHLRNLTAAVLLGSVIAFASSLAQMQLAFALILVLILVGFACLAAFYLLYTVR